jgi:hypothetical protein
MIELTKICNCCHSDKSFDNFLRNSKYKWGFKASCKDCENKKSREKYLLNLESEHARGKAYRLKNTDKLKVKSKIYDEKNRDKIALRKRQYRIVNWDTIRAREKKYYQNNTHKWTYYNKKRDVLLKSRLPKWITPLDLKVIECYYNIANRISSCLGVLHHVDHIIPLQGFIVSGLHTPLNLEVLPARLNLQKGNKWQIY